VPQYAESLNQHYAPTDIAARILERLQQAGKDLDKLTRDDLAAFDEFHGGGRESTRELARLAALAPGMQVLDIGSGVGGPARTRRAGPHTSRGVRLPGYRHRHHGRVLPGGRNADRQGGIEHAGSVSVR